MLNYNTHWVLILFYLEKLRVLIKGMQIGFTHSLIFFFFFFFLAILVSLRSTSISDSSKLDTRTVERRKFSFCSCKAIEGFLLSRVSFSCINRHISSNALNQEMHFGQMCISTLQRTT